MSNAEMKKVMAQNIKRHMDRKGVTNQELCAALGFKYTTFIDWVNAVTYPRIGKIEAMANYFGCEKSDLIEDRGLGPIEEGGLSESQRQLISFAKAVPAELAGKALRAMQLIVAEDS